jgi:hypothetical protein
MEKKQVGKGIKALIPEENEEGNGTDQNDSKGQLGESSEAKTNNGAVQSSRPETDRKKPLKSNVNGKDLDEQISEKRKHEREKRLNAIKKMLGLLSSREGEKAKKKND